MQALCEPWPVLGTCPACQSLLWAMREEPGGRDGRDEVLELPWIDPLVALRQGSP